MQSYNYEFYLYHDGILSGSQLKGVDTDQTSTSTVSICPWLQWSTFESVSLGNDGGRRGTEIVFLMYEETEC